MGCTVPPSFDSMLPGNCVFAVLSCLSDCMRPLQPVKLSCLNAQESAATRILVLTPTVKVDFSGADGALHPTPNDKARAATLKASRSVAAPDCWTCCAWGTVHQPVHVAGLCMDFESSQLRCNAC